MILITGPRDLYANARFRSTRSTASFHGDTFRFSASRSTHLPIHFYRFFAILFLLRNNPWFAMTRDSIPEYSRHNRGTGFCKDSYSREFITLSVSDISRKRVRILDPWIDRVRVGLSSAQFLSPCSVSLEDANLVKTRVEEFWLRSREHNESIRYPGS